MRRHRKVHCRGLQAWNFVIVQMGDTRGRTDAWWLAVLVDACAHLEDHNHPRLDVTGFSRPLNHIRGTAIYKTVSKNDPKKLPTEQGVDVGDVLLAVRFLERLPAARDSERLTFVDDDSTTPVLLNGCAVRKILNKDNKKEIIKRVTVAPVVSNEPEQRVTRRAAANALRQPTAQAMVQEMTARAVKEALQQAGLEHRGHPQDLKDRLSEHMAANPSVQEARARCGATVTTWSVTRNAEGLALKAMHLDVVGL